MGFTAHDFATVNDKTQRKISNGEASELGEANIVLLKQSFPSSPIYSTDAEYLINEDLPGKICEHYRM